MTYAHLRSYNGTPPLRVKLVDHVWDMVPIVPKSGPNAGKTVMVKGDLKAMVVESTHLPIPKRKEVGVGELLFLTARY